MSNIAPKLQKCWTHNINCLKKHIENTKATKFLLQSAFYTSKGSTCKVLPLHGFWFKFYDMFCSSYPVVDFLPIFKTLEFRMATQKVMSQIV